jgi:hypothetical protein
VLFFEPLFETELLENLGEQIPQLREFPARHTL